MSSLKTKYMGLELNNPVIVGSCGLTRNLQGVENCAKAGAGAVVLKSIFEEQITYEVDTELSAGEESLWHPDAMGYVQAYAKENSVGNYLRLISDAKKKVDIPIIASVHCISTSTWPDFAARVESAGADALELNAFVLPSDPALDSASVEKIYFELIKAVKDKVKIPVTLKLGSYFSGMTHTMIELGQSGISGLTLFNRFFSSDIDLEKMELTKAGFLSESNEYLMPLRWMSLLHGRVECDLCATTGVHSAETVIKLLLAGADTVQVVSALYKNGINYLATIIKGLEDWMDAHGYESIDDFKGKLSRKDSSNPASWERVQFIKFSTGVE